MKKLYVEEDRLVITRLRQGLEEAFRAAGAPEHDELLLSGVVNDFDHEEWRW
jgi:hypothetical protein